MPSNNFFFFFKLQQFLFAKSVQLKENLTRKCEKSFRKLGRVRANGEGGKGKVGRGNEREKGVRKKDFFY